MQEEKIFNILKKMATAVEPVANAKLAAAVVHRGNIMAFGTNKKKSHPFQAKFSKNDQAICLHAETDAIKNALKEQDDLSRCTLYIVRVKKAADKKTNITGLARPCEGCMKAIVTFGIKSVKYSLNNEGIGIL